METQYIEHLRSDGSTVYGYGGEALYTFKESEPKKSTAVPRIFGSNRYDTAIAISQKGWQTANTLVLATAGDFPDALAASVLAAKNDAPILLVKGDKIPEATEKQLGSYGSFAIFGGMGAVGETVRERLSQQLNK